MYCVVLPFSTYRAVCCVLYRLVFTKCCLTALTELCVVCCTGLCSNSAALQSSVLCVVPVCVHTVLPYSTYRAVCCVLYRFVFTVLPYSTYRAVCCVLYWFLFTQCCLTALTELHTATASPYRYKIFVSSPCNCKCRPQHYKNFLVFCEVEYAHAQIDDAPCHLYRSFAHETVLK